MIRAIICFVISLAAFICSTVFVVRELIVFPKRFAEQTKKYEMLAAEKFPKKREKLFIWFFFRLFLIVAVSFGIGLACSLLDGISQTSGNNTVGACIVLFGAFPSFILFLNYGERIINEYGLYVFRHGEIYLPVFLFYLIHLAILVQTIITLC